MFSYRLNPKLLEEINRNTLVSKAISAIKAFKAVHLLTRLKLLLMSNYGFPLKICLLNMKTVFNRSIRKFIVYEYKNIPDAVAGIAYCKVRSRNRSYKVFKLPDMYTRKKYTSVEPQQNSNKLIYFYLLILKITITILLSMADKCKIVLHNILVSLFNPQSFLISFKDRFTGVLIRSSFFKTISPYLYIPDSINTYPVCAQLYEPYILNSEVYLENKHISKHIQENHYL